MSLYRSATTHVASPSTVPATVPTRPMVSPCSMKILRITRAGAPIVRRMAMSRLFSMTSNTSDATMLSAATMTISPIVSEIAIFSSQSAE